MRVKFLCGVFLLVFIYGALAEDETYITLEDLESDIYKLLQSDSRSSTPCQSDSDCHNLGTCESTTAEDGTTKSYCKCKPGTSGDSCETVDECAHNSSFCGAQKDVSCVFDVLLERAVCRCDDENKTYVEDEGRCMSPCNYDRPCKNGYCYYEIGDQMFCACYPGASGDYCQIIDQCLNKDVCGTEPDVECKLNKIKGSAYCICLKPEVGFDYDEKICKSCSGCGVNARPSGCVYRNGTRTCNCKWAFYSSNRGVCEDCKCGPKAWSCKFENGDKICECLSGYAQKRDRCETCDCGSDATKCEFSDDRKMCTCKDGFIQHGPDGVCTPLCNATQRCKNGGQCVNSVCRCLVGTSGPLCETIDYCSRGECGQADCFYNVTAKSAYCECRSYRLVFDDYTRTCRECNCGSQAKSCSYEMGEKKCTCSEMYKDRLGTCTLCWCEGHSSLKGCSFDDSGNIKCSCLKGYAQLGDRCQECNCGDNGKCRLSFWAAKNCDCDKGYVERSGMCERCDCGENGKCTLDYYGKKECHCDAGYQIYQGICKDCNCGFNSDCKFDRFGNKECACRSGYGMKKGVCTYCDCYPGTSCTFSGDETWHSIDKECICPHGYADYLGSCKACDCGLEESNCTLVFGIKECQCPKGYEALRSWMDVSCKDIDECLSPQDNDCPLTTKCVNKPGSYDCVCREGYELPSTSRDYDIKKYGCRDIDECIGDRPACIMSHTRCINTPGSFRCECTEGYVVEKDSYAERYNWCKEGDRPWKTASIVVGCLFGTVILGLLIGICNKHCDT